MDVFRGLHSTAGTAESSEMWVDLVVSAQSQEFGRLEMKPLRKLFENHAHRLAGKHLFIKETSFMHEKRNHPFEAKNP